MSRWWGWSWLHTSTQGSGSPGPFGGQGKGLSGFIRGDLHRGMKPTTEGLETRDQPLETGQAQRRGANDGWIERPVSDSKRDAPFDAILLQPDHALGLSVAPGRDGDQPKGSPKQRVPGVNDPHRLFGGTSYADRGIVKVRV